MRLCLQLYDKISCNVVSPSRAPPPDAINRCRDAIDAITSVSGHRYARDRIELVNILATPHMQVSDKVLLDVFLLRYFFVCCAVPATPIFQVQMCTFETICHFDIWRRVQPFVAPAAAACSIFKWRWRIEMAVRVLHIGTDVYNFTAHSIFFFKVNSGLLTIFQPVF